MDWGKEHAKRSAWRADVAERTVTPLAGGPWTLENVVRAAEKLPGPVLVGIDAALGIPQAYFDAARLKIPAWASATDFLPWLRLALGTPGFFTETKTAGAWRHDRPFTAVPKGKGSLREIWTRAGGPLMRAVDTATGAKSPFVVSGIPGTVGSGTRALWNELVPLLQQNDDVRLWPFEGSLAAIRARKKVCLAEIYPRVCYALALDDTLPAPLRRVSKVKAPPRARALAQLLRAAWFRAAGVTLAPKHVEAARDNEDDFDAVISALALLRCVLEGRSLERPGTFDVEGDILGVGLLDLTRAPTGDVTGPDDLSPESPEPARRARTRSAPSDTPIVRSHPCPIVGCTKSFAGSRGGWDVHVAALARHPHWHPAESDPERRKALFREEHAAWFKTSGGAAPEL